MIKQLPLIRLFNVSICSYYKVKTYIKKLQTDVYNSACGLKQRSLIFLGRGASREAQISLLVAFDLLTEAMSLSRLIQTRSEFNNTLCLKMLLARAECALILVSNLAVVSEKLYNLVLNSKKKGKMQSYCRSHFTVWIVHFFSCKTNFVSFKLDIHKLRYCHLSEPINFLLGPVQWITMPHTLTWTALMELNNR